MIKYYINELTVEPVIVLGSTQGRWGKRIKFADGAVMEVLNCDVVNTREEAETLSRFMRLDHQRGI